MASRSTRAASPPVALRPIRALHLRAHRGLATSQQPIRVVSSAILPVTLAEKLRELVIDATDLFTEFNTECE